MVQKLCMNNGQSAALQLSNNQLQTLLTGKFGDGCLHKRTNNKEFCYSTSCIYKDYFLQHYSHHI